MTAALTIQRQRGNSGYKNCRSRNWLRQWHNPDSRKFQKCNYKQSQCNIASRKKLVCPTCLWCLIIAIAVNSSDSKPKAVTGKAESQVVKQQTQDSNVQSSEPVKDTFGLMETAEMNNVQVTMTNYNENYGSEWNKPTDGNVFLLVEFEIANNSTSELAVSSIISFDGYVDGYSASTSFSALLEIHFTDNVWSNNKFKFLLQK